ncbi:hypothetical protein B0T20DRAFT_391114 [Sordaria brevicollis]|uniref:EF-hand domain-containing protein n=1 Tax=Sordaria brevicollis TaxID=83679 RepID=A0AAE0UDL2_SORBR|nr:hypothetical protein B0T20DRAFT_391114 [Sordaria brevicollis]
MASHANIRAAFEAGDRDGDNTLSVREAVVAVEALCGTTLDPEQVQWACNECGVDTGREMDFGGGGDTIAGMPMRSDGGVVGDPNSEFKRRESPSVRNSVRSGPARARQEIRPARAGPVPQPCGADVD